jgi:uncharacterized tellurite resistance protein B-like protein
MPIILVILSTLAFWSLFWFVRMGGIEHVQAKRMRRKEEARLAEARTVSRNAPLRAIDDPREAATILMLLIARTSGDPTREQIAAIEAIVQGTFGFDHQKRAAHMTQARFIASRADSFEQAAAVFADLFNKRLTADEKQQLVDMVEKIAWLDGPSEAHAQAVGVLTRRVGLAPAT